MASERSDSVSTANTFVVWPGNEQLGESLCRALDAPAAALSTRRFPDSETYLRLDDDVRGRSVAVLCTLRDPDAHALPLVFLSDLLRELGATRVGLVAPYLGYMRQDTRFVPGEAVTSASFARLLSAQFDWLVTVDPHLHRRRELGEIYSIKTAAVAAAPLLAKWIREHVAAPLVVGPDVESEQWSAAIAAEAGCPYVVLEKTRRGDRDVSVSAIPPGVTSGRTPVLVDDIISSARTMIETVSASKRAGGSVPVCVGIHGIFALGAHRQLIDAGAGAIVTTNSIPHISNRIDVAPVLAPAIAELW